MAGNWLNSGDNAWQLTAATIVGIQSVPGLVALYGGIVKKKWAVNSAFMALYAFAAVLVAWVLWGYNMGFGPQMYPFVGTPKPVFSGAYELSQASIPAAQATANFPMATMVFFQFVFAAITLIILAGSVLGRMSFKAWMLFVPLWLTGSYVVGAFSLWGGGWLAQMGVIDYSGGYVIHLSAGFAGLIAAWVVGPRLQRDRESFIPNNILVTLIGAGLLWLGWDGFNGGDPYAANADAGVAVLNTNIATAVSLIVWTVLDVLYFKKPSVIGAIQGMITGLVAITPAAGVVNGLGAIIIGICSGIIPWISMNIVGKKFILFKKVDDTLGVFHTHGVAGLLGGLLTGILATPTLCKAFGLSNPGGWMYGNFHQFVLQAEGAGFIIVLNIIVTYVILKLISFITPLRMDEQTLEIGDDAVHGEEAYAFYGEGARKPVLGD